LGVIAYHERRFADAVQAMRQAVAITPQEANYHLNLGVYLKHLGDKAAAIASYERASQLQPDEANIYFNLGNLYREQQDPTAAMAAYTKGIQLHPQFHQAWHNLGNVYRDLEHISAAQECYERTVSIDPQCYEAWFSLGNLHMQKLADYVAAEQCFRRILEVHPHSIEVLTHLGITLQKQQKFQDALATQRRVLERNPHCVEALLNLGSVYVDLGQYATAETYYRKVVEISPQNATVWHYLATMYDRQGEWTKALEFYVRALQLATHDADIHNDLGYLYRQQGDFAQAEQAFRQALVCNPQHVAAWLNLGSLLQDLLRYTEAERSYQQALKIAPHRWEIMHNLGNLCQYQLKYEQAVDWFSRAWQAAPEAWGTLSSLVHQQQQICDWTDLAQRSQLILQNLAQDKLQRDSLPITPFNLITLPVETTAEQQALGTRRWVEHRLQKYQNQRRAVHTLQRTDGKIHVAYLSADFHEHATAYLIAELLERHNSQRFHVSAYSIGQKTDSPMRRRLVNAVQEFVDLSEVSYTAAAQKIVADGVQILVDLKGYTFDSRPQILAQRPAPIQVNYLGYPGTMAAEFMDYIFVDPFVVPLHQQPYYAEKLVYLPGCYQANDSQRAIAARTPTRAECGLPDRGFVFCSFNNSYKITPQMFSLWMRLLQAIPGSVLWLLEGNQGVIPNLTREAAFRGIDPRRMIFAPRKNLPEHLARYRVADLFLDTFPVNAHTTASDALWAGLPVLTLVGNTFVSRVAGSLLQAVGLSEMISNNWDEYEALASRAVHDPSWLNQVRLRLSENRHRCGLFEAGRITRAVETAYEQMWHWHRTGMPPQSFRVE
jgi:predicted O-linked N-acetylglucosamine transferase (SPINDLY family)